MTTSALHSILGGGKTRSVLARVLGTSSTSVLDRVLQGDTKALGKGKVDVLRSLSDPLDLHTGRGEKRSRAMLKATKIFSKATAPPKNIKVRPVRERAGPGPGASTKKRFEVRRDALANLVTADLTTRGLIPREQSKLEKFRQIAKPVVETLAPLAVPGAGKVIARGARALEAGRTARAAGAYGQLSRAKTVGVAAHQAREVFGRATRRPRAVKHVREREQLAARQGIEGARAMQRLRRSNTRRGIGEKVTHAKSLKHPGPRTNWQRKFAQGKGMGAFGLAGALAGRRGHKQAPAVSPRVRRARQEWNRWSRVPEEKRPAFPGKAYDTLRKHDPKYVPIEDGGLASRRKLKRQQEATPHLPEARRRAAKQSRRLWKRVRGAYPGSSKRPPPLNVQRHMDTGAQVRNGRVYVTGKELRGIASGSSTAKNTLLHEWTHVGQKPGLPRWKAEGGAVKLASVLQGRLAGHENRRFSRKQAQRGSEYTRFGRRVQQRKSHRWLTKGQFGVEGKPPEAQGVSRMKGGARVAAGARDLRRRNRTAFGQTPPSQVKGGARSRVQGHGIRALAGGDSDKPEFTKAQKRRVAQRLLSASQNRVEIEGNLSEGQKAFAVSAAKTSGLSPHLMAAWVLREGGNQTGDNNWLNIGHTDSGPDPRVTNMGEWSDPVAAGKLTGQWIKGQGKAAAAYPPADTISAIGKNAKHLSDAQAAEAIANSGWASSGAGPGDTYSQVSVTKKPFPKHLRQRAERVLGPKETREIIKEAHGLAGGAPVSKQTMTRFKVIKKAAKALDKSTEPYVWGGGHGSDPFQGTDCSGAVSYVLQKAGLLKGPLTSGSFANIGKPGPGAVTIFSNSEHVFMRIGDKYFGTSGQADVPGGGAGFWRGTFKPGQDYLNTFTATHIPMGALDKKGKFSFPGMAMSSDGGSAKMTAGTAVGAPGTSDVPIKPQAALSKQEMAGIGGGGGVSPISTGLAPTKPSASLQDILSSVGSRKSGPRPRRRL